MGASYGKQRKAKAGKLDFRFTALPHTVIHSVQYRGLGFAARALLFDIAAQYNRANNGKLVCSEKYLQPLGWKSHDTITRALRELTASGLLIPTRQGMRPPMSQPAWFALGWFDLDVWEGLDIDPRKYQRCPLTQINLLIPIAWVAKPKSTPINGVAGQSTTPIIGTIEAQNDDPHTPIYGEFIDLPSTHPIIHQHMQLEASAHDS